MSIGKDALSEHINREFRFHANVDIMNHQKN